MHPCLDGLVFMSLFPIKTRFVVNFYYHETVTWELKTDEKQKKQSTEFVKV
jgi:hypothetical protein